MASSGRGSSDEPSVAGNGADARDRSEHRVGPVVDGFLVEIDDAAGIRQIVRHEHDAAYRQRNADELESAGSLMRIR